MENKQLDLATSRDQADGDGRKAILLIPTSKCCIDCFQYSHSNLSSRSNDWNRGKIQSSPTDFFIYSPLSPLVKKNLLSLEVTPYTPSGAARRKCYICGLKLYPRSCCLVRKTKCHKGGRDNSLRFVDQAFCHFIWMLLLRLVAYQIQYLSNAILTVKINRAEMNALVDTGSSKIFYYRWYCKKNRIKIVHVNSLVAITNASLSSQDRGYVLVSLELNQNKYIDIKFSVMQYGATNSSNIILVVISLLLTLNRR